MYVNVLRLWLKKIFFKLIKSPPTIIYVLYFTALFLVGVFSNQN